jgi:hypothetical protein
VNLVYWGAANIPYQIQGGVALMRIRGLMLLCSETNRVVYNLRLQELHELKRTRNSIPFLSAIFCRNVITIKNCLSSDSYYFLLSFVPPSLVFAPSFLSFSLSLSLSLSLSPIVYTCPIPFQFLKLFTF